MKIKAAITAGTPLPVSGGLSSATFALDCLKEVAEKCLGAQNAAGRPAEFYVQLPDETINTGTLGVEVRLTGVSRGTRSQDQFAQALSELNRIVTCTVAAGLNAAASPEEVQVFCVIMLDGDVRLPEKAGEGYSSVLEHPAVWVSADGVEKKADQ